MGYFLESEAQLLEKRWFANVLKKFGPEFTQEIWEEWAESAANKIDSRLGSIVSFLTCLWGKTNASLWATNVYVESTSVSQDKKSSAVEVLYTWDAAVAQQWFLADAMKKWFAVSENFLAPWIFIVTKVEKWVTTTITCKPSQEAPSILGLTVDSHKDIYGLTLQWMVGGQYNYEYTPPTGKNAKNQLDVFLKRQGFVVTKNVDGVITAIKWVEKIVFAVKKDVTQKITESEQRNDANNTETSNTDTNNTEDNNFESSLLHVSLQKKLQSLLWDATATAKRTVEEQAKFEKSIARIQAALPKIFAWTTTMEDYIALRAMEDMGPDIEGELLPLMQQIITNTIRHEMIFDMLKQKKYDESGTNQNAGKNTTTWKPLTQSEREAHLENNKKDLTREVNAYILSHQKEFHAMQVTPEQVKNFMEHEIAIKETLRTHLWKDAVIKVKFDLNKSVVENIDLLIDGMIQGKTDLLSAWDKLILQNFVRQHTEAMLLLDPAPSSDRIFALTQENIQKAVFQNIADKGLLSGSDHGILHVIQGDALTAFSIIDQYIALWTCSKKQGMQLKAMVGQMIVDHDIWYNMKSFEKSITNSPDGSYDKNTFFGMTKDHPIFSRMRVDTHSASYEWVFGKQNLDAMKIAMLDHSDVHSVDFSAAMHNLASNPGDTVNLQNLLQMLISTPDCLWVTHVDKLHKMSSYPEITEILVKFIGVQKLAATKPELASKLYGSIKTELNSAILQLKMSGKIDQETANLYNNAIEKGIDTAAHIKKKDKNDPNEVGKVDNPNEFKTTFDLSSWIYESHGVKIDDNWNPRVALTMDVTLANVLFSDIWNNVLNNLKKIVKDFDKSASQSIEAKFLDLMKNNQAWGMHTIEATTKDGSKIYFDVTIVTESSNPKLVDAIEKWQLDQVLSSNAMREIEQQTTVQELLTLMRNTYEVNDPELYNKLCTVISSSQWDIVTLKEFLQTTIAEQWYIQKKELSLNEDIDVWTENELGWFMKENQSAIDEFDKQEKENNEKDLAELGNFLTEKDVTSEKVENKVNEKISIIIDKVNSYKKDIKTELWKTRAGRITMKSITASLTVANAITHLGHVIEKVWLLKPNMVQIFASGNNVPQRLWWLLLLLWDVWKRAFVVYERMHVLHDPSQIAKLHSVNELSLTVETMVQTFKEQWKTLLEYGKKIHAFDAVMQTKDTIDALIHNTDIAHVHQELKNLFRTIELFNQKWANSDVVKRLEATLLQDVSQTNVDNLYIVLKTIDPHLASWDIWNMMKFAQGNASQKIHKVTQKTLL
jgi:hypothetical protein